MPLCCCGRMCIGFALLGVGAVFLCTGAAGKPGADGKAGPAGKDGKPGAAGKAGPAGKDGDARCRMRFGFLSIDAI